MSGRKIDDHSFWAGKRGRNSVFPDGPHKEKEEMSAEGSGYLGSAYPDTTEQIREDQMKGDRKIKERPMKPGYRN
jgi:hypothetical protein